MMSNPHRYLSTTDIAHILNIKPTSLSKYNLPEADVYIGRTRGWSQTTIDTWLTKRPGQGYRTDLHPTETSKNPPQSWRDP